MKKIAVVLALVISLAGCGIYSFTGGQFSGAKTFSVEYFRPQTALATPLYAQRLTESLKDVLLAQSPLRLAEQEGDLRYSGMVVDYSTAPVAIQAGAAETASLNRLTISVKVTYENTIESELNF